MVFLLISRGQWAPDATTPDWGQVPSANVDLLRTVAQRLREIGNSAEAIRAEAAADSFQREIDAAIENAEVQKLAQDHFDKVPPNHLPRY
jgi:hypothetical protein